MSSMSLLMRGRLSIQQSSALVAASRGGFHRPDPKTYPLYKYTRRTHMEDVNTVFYSDFAPEFHLHLHSIQIQHSRQGYALCLAYFIFIICPMWLAARQLHVWAGNMMFPSMRPTGDTGHMIPRLAYHLKANNFEKRDDFLGRRTAEHYKNWVRPDAERKPKWAIKMNDHGFAF